jgi:hypothetical protein
MPLLLAVGILDDVPRFLEPPLSKSSSLRHILQYVMLSIEWNVRELTR